MDDRTVGIFLIVKLVYFPINRIKRFVQSIRIIVRILVNVDIYQSLKQLCALLLVSEVIVVVGEPFEVLANHQTYRYSTVEFLQDSAVGFLCLWFRGKRVSQTGHQSEYNSCSLFRLNRYTIHMWL